MKKILTKNRAVDFEKNRLTLKYSDSAKMTSPGRQLR